jgi:excisionase family DNA binding protein
MTVQEISKYLRLHPGTVYRLAKAGQLPGFKIGDSWRFDLQRVDRWLEHGHHKQGGTK